MNRSIFIKSLFGVGALLVAQPVKALNQLAAKLATQLGNFAFVYRSKELRNQFFYFLKNVFHLFPETEFHQLIHQSAKQHDSDKKVYEEVQGKLESITPGLSIINYQLPALLKQKEVMAKQTTQLLKKGSVFNGYLEIGSLGRYLDYLEEEVTINGKRYYADGREPSYGIADMIDRGQMCIGADYIPFTDYNTDYTQHIAPNSIDLVTVYIGFHHCPIELRTSFISSIAKVMRKGGKLILRDHDCNSESQTRIVALAHDVFNMGTDETWEYNAKEVRNFYSLKFIIDFVSKLGFRFEKQTLFQEGDPTKNALMLFTKL